MYDTQNTRWLSRAYPDLYAQIQLLAWVGDGLSNAEQGAIDQLLYIGATDIANLEAVLELPWVRDGLSDAEQGTIDQLLYIGATDIANLEAVLELPWVQDAITENEHETIHRLQSLNYREAKIAGLVITMPFLASVETDDVLAIRGMHGLAYYGLLSVLVEHPTYLDGITDDETTLIAAATTLKDAEEIKRLLDPGYASIETVSGGTRMTPNLRISIIRTGTQSRPGTTDAVRDAVEFVERSMQLPLPVDHVIVVLNEKAVLESFAGTNYGFAISFLPKYEQRQGTFEWRHLQAGFVHEVAHYYWAGNEDWIDEGMADIIEYQYGVKIGLSRGQLKNRRKGCDAHDLAMLSEWDPSKSSAQFRCNYYLGLMLFQALLENMGAEAFSTKIGELYRLSLAGPDAGGALGVDAVRRVFSGQSDIVDLHWSGAVNAPENRPFDEGKGRTSHDLIQWDQYPIYDGRSFSFRGTLLDGAVLSKATIYQARDGGYQNFTISRADAYDHVGTILPSLLGGRSWTLDDPGDSVATTYRLGDREFKIQFLFPKALGGPSDYVVLVWGFQDDSRTPKVSDKVDLLGYARIRLSPTAP